MNRTTQGSRLSYSQRCSLGTREAATLSFLLYRHVHTEPLANLMISNNFSTVSERCYPAGTLAYPV